MADLLTDAQREEAYLAFKDLSDTLFKTDVSYALKIGSLDRAMEDRKKEETVYNLKCLVEYGNKERDQLNREKDGAEDDSTCTALANLRDLKALGLVNDANEFLGASERDYFTVNSQLYKLVLWAYDGPLTQENIFIVLTGEKKEKNS